MGESGQGIFITFEGGDGAGKTTHMRFLAEELEARGYEVLRVREPGGTDIGEQLRRVVLDPENDAMCFETELLIYEASRAQIVSEVIRPALERGAVVLCDRFADSTVAYQAYGRGIDRAVVDRVNDFACQGLRPDRTILMVTGGSTKAGLARATHLGADRMELAGEDFHARVNAAYLKLAEKEPERVRTVVSADRKSRTSQLVFRELVDLFPWMAEVVDDPAFFARLDKKRPKKGKGGQDEGRPAAPDAAKEDDAAPVDATAVGNVAAPVVPAPVDATALADAAPAADPVPASPEEA